MKRQSAYRENTSQRRGRASASAVQRAVVEAIELRLLLDGLPPVVQPNSAQTPAQTPVVIDVLANDSAPEGQIDPTSVVIGGDPLAQPQRVVQTALEGGFRQQVVGASLFVISNQSRRLFVYDISDPVNPVLAGQSDVLTDSSLRDIEVDGDIACIGADDKVFFLDIANPESPALLGSIALGSRGVCIEGTTAVTVDGANGIHVIDIANPASPSLVRSYSAFSPVQGVDMHGNIVYVAAGSYFCAYDLSSPSIYSVCGYFGVAGSYDWPRALTLSGSMAFIARSSGLDIIDVTNPAQPSVLSHYALQGASEVVVDDGAAYVSSNMNDGLVVLDISDPAAPARIGSTPAYAFGLALAGNFVYTSTGDNSELGVIRVRGGFPDHGTAHADPASGQITYTPADGFAGSDSFTYTVAATNGARSEPAAVDVVVQAPPCADLTVAIDDVVLPSIIAPGDLGTVSLTVDNLGDTAPDSAFTVELFLSADDLFDPSDLLIGSSGQTLLGPDAGQSLPIDVDVQIPTPVPSGTYWILAVVDREGAIDEHWLSGGEENNTIASTSTWELRQRFGTFEGSAIPSITLDDPNGPVTFTLQGEGYGFAEWDNATGGFQIETFETNTGSALRITLPPGASTWVTGLTVAGSIGQIAAPLVKLAGNVAVEGTAARIQFDDAGWNHRIDIGAPAQSGDTVALVFDCVRNLSVFSQTPVASITATEWIDRGGEIDRVQTPSLGTLLIRGDRARKLGGDFAADVELTGVSNTRTLGSINIAGWLDGSIIRSAGSIGAIVVGGMRNSSILAGVKGTILPRSKLSFTSAASIGVFSMTGIGAAASWFINSNIAAWNLSNVRLSNVAESGPSWFGLAGHRFYKVTWARRGVTLTWGRNWSAVRGRLIVRAF